VYRRPFFTTSLPLRHAGGFDVGARAELLGRLGEIPAHRALGDRQPGGDVANGRPARGRRQRSTFPLGEGALALTQRRGRQRFILLLPLFVDV
jgi:hypothetical protein